MALATIKLAQFKSIEMYVSPDPAALARQKLAEGLYKTISAFPVDGEGEAAADEVFDLTNNPFRDEERALVYGRGRSVSVGDIVSVDGTDYLCCSEGWAAL